MNRDVAVGSAVSTCLGLFQVFVEPLYVLQEEGREGEAERE